LESKLIIKNDKLILTLVNHVSFFHSFLLSAF